MPKFTVHFLWDGTSRGAPRDEHSVTNLTDICTTILGNRYNDSRNASALGGSCDVRDLAAQPRLYHLRAACVPWVRGQNQVPPSFQSSTALVCRSGRAEHRRQIDAGASPRQGLRRQARGHPVGRKRNGRPLLRRPPVAEEGEQLCPACPRPERDVQQRKGERPGVQCTFKRSVVDYEGLVILRGRSATEAP